MQLNRLNKTKFWFTVFEIFLFALIPFIYGMRFYNTDDIHIRNMLTGSIQFNITQHVLFFPSWYSAILIKLYELYPRLEWYFIVYYLILLISITVVIIKLSSISFKDNLIILIFWLFFYFTYGKQIFTEVHFTTVAGIASISGCLLLINLNDRGKLLKIIIGVVLLLFGMIYRAQASVLVVTGLICADLSYKWIIKNNPLFNDWKIYSKVVVTVAILFFINFISFKSEPKRIRDNWAYRENVGKLFDYKYLNDRALRENALNKVGWDSTEYNLLSWYIIPSRKEFSPKVISNLAQNGKRNAIGLIDLTKILSFYTDIQYGFPFILAFIIFVSIYSTYRNKIFLYIGIMIVFNALLLLGLRLLFKYPNQYLITPLFLAWWLYIIQASKLGVLKISLIWFTTALGIGILTIGGIYKRQSEFIHWIRYYLPRKSNHNEYIKNKYLINFSMMARSYSYPKYYLGNFYDRLDIDNAYYIYTGTFHPDHKLIYSDSNKDVFLWLINNKNACLYFDQGYETQPEYILPDISNYIRKYYSIDPIYRYVKANNGGLEIFIESQNNLKAE